MIECMICHGLQGFVTIMVPRLSISRNSPILSMDSVVRKTRNILEVNNESTASSTTYLATRGRE